MNDARPLILTESRHPRGTSLEGKTRPRRERRRYAEQDKGTYREGKGE